MDFKSVGKNEHKIINILDYEQKFGCPSIKLKLLVLIDFLRLFMAGQASFICQLMTFIELINSRSRFSSRSRG